MRSIEPKKTATQAWIAILLVLGVNVREVYGSPGRTAAQAAPRNEGVTLSVDHVTFASISLRSARCTLVGFGEVGSRDPRGVRLVAAEARRGGAGLRRGGYEAASLSFDVARAVSAATGSALVYSRYLDIGTVSDPGRDAFLVRTFATGPCVPTGTDPERWLTTWLHPRISKPGRELVIRFLTEYALRDGLGTEAAYAHEVVRASLDCEEDASQCSRFVYMALR